MKKKSVDYINEFQNITIPEINASTMKQVINYMLND